MEGQFDGPPRRQKLVALYGEKFPRSDPKTEFFNTISRSCPGSAVYHNEVGLGNGYLRRLLVVGATSVTRRAPTTDMQQIFHVAQRQREPDIEHHRQANDFGTGFEVAKWIRFCHPTRLQNRPARLKLVLSDGVDGSTRTASHCAMLVLFATNRWKEPST